MTKDLFQAPGPSRRTRGGVRVLREQRSKMKLILASASPRRAEILRNAGIQFEVRATDVDESRLTGEVCLLYTSRERVGQRDWLAEHRGESVCKRQAA